MVSITADSRDIERSLHKLVALSKKAGAEFHDDLVVKCVDQDLSIEAPPDTAGKVLIRLPWDCLVPLQPFELSVADDNIVILGHEEGLTRECVARMKAFLELYNLTNKLAAHRRTSPWPLVASHPELLAYITRGRGRGSYVISGNLHLPGKENELLLQSFLHSRAFDYKVTGQQTPALPLNLRVLLPVLDSMNHHFNGSPFTYEQHDSDRFVTIARSAALPGMGNECFAFYGKHDSFDTWMTYGFIDESVPFLSSVGMTLALPGLGSIRVTNIISNRTDGELPEMEKDLYFYVPKLLARRGNDIEVASLLIPGPGAPRSLQRTLNFLITEIHPGHPKQRDLVLHAEQQIIATNRTYYQKLAAFLRSLPPRDSLQRPILNNFIRVCDLQIAHIQNYCNFPKG